MTVPTRERCVHLIGRAMLILTTILALPHEAVYADDAVSVSGAWVRATVPGQSVGAAYMEFKASAPAAVTAARTPVAAKAQFHTMSMNGGVMQMRELAKLTLKPGSTALTPEGDHIMLVDLKHPLKAGERVPLEFTVQDAKGAVTTLRVEAEVRPITAGASAPMNMPMH